MQGEPCDNEPMNLNVMLMDLEECVPLSVGQGKAVVQELIGLRDECEMLRREKLALISETADMIDTINRLESRVELQAIALRSQMAERETALTVPAAAE